MNTDTTNNTSAAVSTDSATPVPATPVVAEFRKTIWVSKKPDFEQKVQHLNRILLRNGKDPIRFAYDNYRIEKVTFTYHEKGDAFRNDKEETHFVEVCDAVCTGLTIVRKGDVPFTYLGSVSFADGVKQVFCNNEDYSRFFLEDFRANYCDHCNTTRTNRKTYFLFLDPTTGKVVQIGSTCAKEYFGITSAAFLETYGKTFFVEYSGCPEDMVFGKGSVGYSFDDIAPVVSYCTNGFTKWHKASEGGDDFGQLWDQPTTEAVRTMLNSWEGWEPIWPRKTDNENCEILSHEEVLAFWTAKYEKEHSTFAANCMEAIKAGYTTSRSLGSFCYAIFAAFNAKVRAMQDAEAAKNAVIVPCAYPVNSRQTISGVITGIRTFTDNIWQTASYRNPYGDEVTKYIVDFTEDNGTRYHFTTSSVSFADLKMGDRISMRCTINDTKPFKGIPYTHVSRPKATLLTPADSAPVAVSA